MMAPAAAFCFSAYGTLAAPPTTLGRKIIQRWMMKYSNGDDVLIGDNVIADDSEGVVVSVLDTK